MYNIPIAKPSLIGNEINYVNDCLKTNWISSIGDYIEKFENEFAKYVDINYATTCSNGTVAIHLALMALDIKNGDEIIVPTFTYIASVNAIKYCNATPIFVDSEIETWNLDLKKIEEAITSKTKAILAVHLYGNPINMDILMKIANKHNLFVIEDCAEAHGAKYKNKSVGSFGIISTFSFYGNKILTTGEGGMVVSNDENLIAKIKLLKSQGMDPKNRYWFPIIGYNYRMTNIQAAIGLAQLENSDLFNSKRQKIFNFYNQNLKNIKEIKFQNTVLEGVSVNWLYSIVLEKSAKLNRDELMLELRRKGIDSRPFFYPVHLLPPYQTNEIVDSYPIAELLGSNGINLPTFYDLSEDELAYICKTLNEIL
jgi:perosamine synthetase